MRRSDFESLIKDYQEAEQNMTAAGQKEYAHGSDDVLDNFNRVAALVGVDRKAVLATYMLKHIDGIMAYIKGHKSQREDVRGRIVDARVYLLLLLAMIEEDKEAVDDWAAGQPPQLDHETYMQKERGTADG